MRKRVAIVGGGISGLAAAYRLIELQPSFDIVVLEAGPRLGGVLNTTHQDGFLMEDAADGFLTSPSTAIDLCERLGLQAELMRMRQTGRRAFVLDRGRLLPVPNGFQLMAPRRLKPLLGTPILSWHGKLRATCELFIPRKTTDVDESLQSFVCRRFGREVFDRLVQPLAGGIHASDPQRQSLEATFPQFRQMERDHGSILRTMLRSRPHATQDEASGARYGQFATLKGGMSTLVNALVNRLPANSTRVRSPVLAMTSLENNRWLLTVGGTHPQSLTVDGVVIATPACRAANLLRHTDVQLAAELAGIEYAGCAVVSLGYWRDQITHPLDGFGFVVPLIAKRMILSCSFSSVKYTGRAANNRVLLRVIIGGACQRELLRLPKEDLIELAEREVAELLSIHGEPILRRIAMHDHSMPQYHVGHRDRVSRIESRVQQYASLALAGSSLNGIGVPACIRSGEAAAARITDQIKAAHPQHKEVVA